MLSIERVSHAYEDIVSLREVSLQLEKGEILCLLGPSGCGKTTLLRIIAGLETEYQGKISFEGDDIDRVPAHQRQFGLMFQDFALFPHLSVAENIAYGLKRRRQSKHQISLKTSALLHRVGLQGLDDRDVTSLSGGQQQRVALARSLAPNPRLLMLDEPLGSLDAQLRDQLALELRQIIKSEGLSAIYVTHDHREAYAVADRIAVMNTGSIQQHNTPGDLYHNPKNAFVARFLGMRNIFAIDHNSLTRQLAPEATALSADDKYILIHPAGIHLSSQSGKAARHVDAILERIVFRGDYHDVTVSLDEDIQLTFSSAAHPGELGAAVQIYISFDAVKGLHE